MAGEISPGSPSYTLTELLHAVNIMMYFTELANASAHMFESLGLDVDSSGYTIQTIATDEEETEEEET